MASPAPALQASSARPRVGLIGVGWIGVNRLKALAAAQTTEIACIADSSHEAAERAAREHSPDAQVVGSLRELFQEALDGVVIATPSGQHAEQAARSLEHGLAVFCQKPLACTSLETRHVIEAARVHDRLLSVDFCYRSLAGVAELARLVQSGALGEIYCADLLFHNAYGPDKPWFYDIRQSGGGCVMDLGIHLIDLLLWVLAYPPVAEVHSRLHAGGKLLRLPTREVEDHAMAEIQFASGATARIACSWRLPAGRDAVIEAAFYGTRGAATVRNVDGSFYDFVVEHCVGTTRTPLARGPDAWGGRMVCAWARQLGACSGFDPAALHLSTVAQLIDAIYGRA